MDDATIERELAAAQEAFKVGTRQLRERRQAAVMAAREAGWTKYRIAAAMGAHGPTVDSIITAAEREER